MKINTSSTNHIAQAKEIATSILGKTPEEHNMFIYELGVLYLEHRKMYDRWSRNEQFWKWLRLQYGICCLQALQNTNCLSLSNRKKRSHIERFKKSHDAYIKALFSKFPKRDLIERPRRSQTKILN